MIDILKSIGIEKGKPFNPDAKNRSILTSAAREAHALLESRYEGIFTPYFDISRWALPALPDYLKAAQDGFSDPNAYPFDTRGLSSPSLSSRKSIPGTGQFYLMTVKDKDGQNFDGSKSYRLTVPANAPVNQYWSATVYDRATHGLIRNMSRSGRGSQSQGLQKNADGSVDIWFGPKAPAGKDSNWVPTTRADNSKCSSASTAPKSRCSTRRGSCRTSSGSLLSEKERSHEKSSRSNLRRLASHRNATASHRRSRPAKPGQQFRARHSGQLHPRRVRTRSLPASWRRVALASSSTTAN